MFLFLTTFPINIKCNKKFISVISFSSCFLEFFKKKNEKNKEKKLGKREKKS